MLSLWCKFAHKLPSNFFFKLVTSILFRMSKSSLGSIRMIDMHTEDMGGLGRWEDLLLIKLNLQCIAYGVYDNVEFWKRKWHDSECFKLNESALMHRVDGYQKRNEEGPGRVSSPPPSTPSQQHQNKWICRLADLIFHRWEFKSNIIWCFPIE